MLSFILVFLLEIQSVSVTWNPQVCSGTCVKLLEKGFTSNPGVADSNINIDQGRAILYWKPNVPFNYGAVKRIFQSVGVGFNPFELKVRGTVGAQGKEFYLTSIGDNTRFSLIGPVPKSNNQYVTRGNLSLHLLQGDLLAQVRDAASSGRVVQVSGALYMAETPPYRLLIEHISTAQENAK